MRLFITNIPSFYKINLYNRINEYSSIYVVYTGYGSAGRNDDFYSGQMHFPHKFLQGNGVVKCLYTIYLLLFNRFDEVIVGGWDTVPNWIAVFLAPKRKTSIVVESSIFESSTAGCKSWLKRLILRNVQKAYASGQPHKRLLEVLGFKGEIVITKGVGIFNIVPQPQYTSRTSVRKFLYVGRLVKVKNLEFIINIFNRHPEFELTIIGFGVEEKRLKSIASDNIRFLGAIANKELSKYYQAADVFILPSFSEPWGLVVEEALNNGLPTMVSDRVGCHEDLVNKNTGVVFSLTDESFEEKLREITFIPRYNKMREYISLLNYKKIQENQIICYL